MLKTINSYLTRWAFDKRIAFILFVAAVLTRLIGAYMGGTRAEDDDRWHYQIAMNFLQGQGLMLMTEYGPTYSYIQPGFAFVHVLFMSLFKNFFLMERLFLLVFSSLTILAFFQLCKYLFTPACALLGTLILLFYPPQWFWMTRLNPHSFATNVLVLCFWLLFIAWKKRSVGLALAIGFLWGVLTLLRPEYQMGLAALALGSFLALEGRALQAKFVLALFLGLGVALGPWAIRNYRIHGFPVASTTHYGINFWMVFNPDYHYEVENISPGPALLEKLEKEPNEVLRARIFIEEAKTYIRNNPKDSVKKIFGNFFRYWRPYLSPRVTPLFENFVYVISYGPIFILFLVGLFHIPWRDPKWIAIVGFLAYKVAAHIPFYMIVRFREATMPIMLIIALLPLQALLRKNES